MPSAYRARGPHARTRGARAASDGRRAGGMRAGGGTSRRGSCARARRARARRPRDRRSARASGDPPRAPTGARARPPAQSEQLARDQQECLRPRAATPRVPSTAHSTTAETPRRASRRRALHHVAIPLVAELVCDDQLHLGRPPSRAVSYRTRGAFGRGPRRTRSPSSCGGSRRRRHVPHRHAGRLAQRAQLGRELLVLERTETVEEGLEQQGRDG